VWLIDEALPVPAQIRVSRHDRTQGRVAGSAFGRADVGEPIHETQKAADVVAIDRRNGHPAVNPFDDERDPVSVVDDAEQAWRRNTSGQRHEHLAFASVHARCDRVQIEPTGLDEDGATVRKLAASCGSGREPAIQVRHGDHRAAGDRVDLLAHGRRNRLPTGPNPLAHGAITSHRPTPPTREFNQSGHRARREVPRVEMSRRDVVPGAMSRWSGVEECFGVADADGGDDPEFLTEVDHCA
jgi:hypothetical protein